jgi:subtilisin-like proprotein convertase family protein
MRLGASFRLANRPDCEKSKDMERARGSRGRRLGRVGFKRSLGSACEPLEERRLLSATAYEQSLASADVPDLAVDIPTAQSFARLDSVPIATPFGTSSPGGLSPAQIRHAYGIDQISFSGGTIVGDGAGQTVAIVTAFDTPTIGHDLQSFSTAFGLTVPTISDDLTAFYQPQNSGDPPRFVRVGQDGSNVFPTTEDSGWALETALDVEWVHAIAPKANIMLVEATTPSFGDLVQSAVDFARHQSGVSVVSMSWGFPDFSGETSFDTYFTTTSNHAGVSFVAASGDSGSPGSYPAFSPKVLAVGGTNLSLNASNNISSETGWSGSGGGISQYEVQPAYQSGVVTQSSTQRTSPDVAFNGGSSTGVSVYDSFNNGTDTPWRIVGGTSFSAPAWAGIVAIADQGRALSLLPTLDGTSLLTKIYAMPSSNFNDITSGTSTGTPNLSAGAGYDLVTGRGSPKANLLVPSLVGTSSITGVVFNDVNGNGTKESEPGLGGWTTYADLNNNSAFDPIVTNTFNASDLPPSKTIPTIGTITSNNVVSGLAGNIIDVNVTLKINHTRDSDLVLTLISPLGTRIKLANHVGGTGDNFTNTTFDDSAAVAISLGAAPFSSTYQPTNPLSVLFGNNPNGTWQLEVADTVSGTGGSLVSWSLQLTTGDPNATSAANGSYAINNLPTGSYHVAEVLQPGFQQTSPAGGFYTTAVAGGITVSGKDFGNLQPPSSVPSGVMLMAASDTGASNSDGVTKLNNNSPASSLQFQVFGTIAGATVTLFADGVAIGSATANGTTTTVTTDGLSALIDGGHSITARQTESGKQQSAASPVMAITVDATAPNASIVPVSPNPRATGVSAITINFDEPVSGLTLADLALSRGGGGDLLSGSQNVTSGDGVSWSLADLTTLTSPTGAYELDLSGPGSTISDLAGNLFTQTVSTNFTVASGIVGRRLFYNQSGTGPSGTIRYDGNDAAINSRDDFAIASDKVAYLPGSGAATFANVSSYSKGINGIMVDIAGPHGAISLDDFVFRVGNNNTPSSWLPAPAPSGFSVRAGAGSSGSDRVEIIWANGAIQKQWLEVITLAGADTGLAQSATLPAGQADAFFFGNALADSGLFDTATNATVDGNDELAARNNQVSVLTNIPITNPYDYNRDGAVDGNDGLVARNNQTNLSSVTKFLNLTNPPAAPQAGAAASGTPGGTSGVVPLTSSGGIVPGSSGLVDLALAAPLAQQRQQTDARGDWLSFADEQLYDLLAMARRSGTRRR